MGSRPRLVVALRVIAATLLVIALDQYSKSFIQATIEPGERIPIISGFFDITLTYNKGVAFGLLSDISSNLLRYTFLGLTTVLALCAVVYFFVKELSGSLSGQLAFSLIVGGALGNIIDRVRLGHVVDFLLAYYKSYHWPVFNVADSCISIGVVILIIFHSAARKA